MAHYLVRARLRPELAEELREDVLDRLLRPAGPGPGVEEEAGKGPGAAQSLHRAPHPAGVGQRNPVPGPNGHHGHHLEARLFGAGPPSQGGLPLNVPRLLPHLFRRHREEGHVGHRGAAAFPPHPLQALQAPEVDHKPQRGPEGVEDLVKPRQVAPHP